MGSNIEIFKHFFLFASYVVIQKWFELTKYSSQPDCTLEDVYEKERLLSFQ